MPKLSAEQAVEFVTNEWLAGRTAAGPIDLIQAGGEGNGLLMKQYASHYRGSRIWTDGTTIYSYTTPLLTHNAGTIKQEPYYANGKYSNTTKRQIQVINRILTVRNK